MPKEFWDSKFSSKEYIYGIKPNDFLKSYLDGNKPGKLLLPGDGEGRNAVYAAKKGWEVTALDYSVAGKEKALKLANEHQIEINYFISDVESFETNEKFDLISLIFLHLSPEVRSEAHSKLIRFLKPTGKILMECFSKEQISNNSGGPKSLSLLYSKEDIENDFKALNFQMLEKQEIKLNEGMLHQGKASVIRMIAEMS